MKELTYEESMKELEQVVRELESGELTLDDSITKFEKGMKLLKHCTELLENAEKKITVLLEGSDGSYTEEKLEIVEE